jgi:hypothetical protein
MESRLMDLTPIEHAAISIIATAIGWACGDIYAGAAAGIFFFGGREHAQAECRAIQRFYDNRRANAPWHVGFQTRAWDVASVLDVLVPAVAVGIILIVKGLIK